MYLLYASKEVLILRINFVIVIVIDSQNILYKFQFGFRKQFSTSHAIISLVEKIRSVLTSGKFMIGVFLDLKKAFDTVNRAILIKKTICIWS